MGISIKVLALAATLAVAGTMAMAGPEGIRLPDGQPQTGLNQTDIAIVPESGTRRLIHVEVANTALERNIGMMYRKSVPKDTGMLFIFEADAELNFWMKNTYVPLDIVFLRNDGTVVSVKENATPLSLDGIPSHGASRAVLELAGGAAKDIGVAPGARIEFVR